MTPAAHVENAHTFPFFFAHDVGANAFAAKEGAT